MFPPCQVLTLFSLHSHNQAHCWCHQRNRSCTVPAFGTDRVMARSKPVLLISCPPTQFFAFLYIKDTHHRQGTANVSARSGRRTCPRWQCRPGHSCSCASQGRCCQMGMQCSGLQDKGQAVRPGTCRRNLSSLPHNIKRVLSVVTHAEKGGRISKEALLELW